MTDTTAAVAEETVTLTSMDEEVLVVPVRVAKHSSTIANMLDDVGKDGGVVPIPNVTGRILTKVIDYCTRIDVGSAGVENIVTGVDQSTLFELILAANYLDVKPLLELGCKTVADMIKGKSPDEIRATFNIKNDFTPEEEEQVRKELEWAVANDQ